MDYFRALVVDDEQDFLETLVNRLGKRSIDTSGVKSGEEAIEKARTGRYDLITLDLIMPEMSGLDALDAIKKVQPQVPVMIITGNATDKLIREAGVLGACRVLYKPVLLEDFVNELTARLVGPDRKGDTVG